MENFTWSFDIVIFLWDIWIGILKNNTKGNEYTLMIEFSASPVLEYKLTTDLT